MKLTTPKNWRHMATETWESIFPEATPHDARGIDAIEDVLNQVHNAVVAEAERERSECNSVSGGWIPLTDARRPVDGERVWIAGYGFRGRFYAEAEYRRGEWLMFDQEVDEHIHPCEYPRYWRPIEPIPEVPTNVTGRQEVACPGSSESDAATGTAEGPRALPSKDGDAGSSGPAPYSQPLARGHSNG